MISTFVIVEHDEITVGNTPHPSMWSKVMNTAPWRKAGDPGRRAATTCLILVMQVVGPAIAQDTLSVVRDAVQRTSADYDLPWSTAGFGYSIACIGDLDNNGRPDLVVGDPTHQAGRGCVYVLFMADHSSVLDTVRIASGTAGFTTLDANDRFGRGIAAIGDLDGDGITELAVLATGDDDGASDRGAVYILFMDSTASLTDFQKISDTAGGFSGDMSAGNDFNSIGAAGDMDLDGIPDLIIGAPGSSTGCDRCGAIWLLHLDEQGEVGSYLHYSGSTFWPDGAPMDTTHIGFGTAVTGLGDIDGDGVPDMAASVPKDDGGAIHVIRRYANGGVKANSRINEKDGHLHSMDIDPGSGRLGQSLISIGDMNADGVPDLAAANIPTDTTDERGIVFIYLTDSGTVQYDESITAASLPGPSRFGYAMTIPGDMDGDMVPDLVTATPYFPTAATQDGAMHFIFLNPKPLRALVETTPVMLPDSLGAAFVNVVGGVRPYHDTAWYQGSIDETSFSDWKTAFEEYDWNKHKIPEPDISALTYSSLLGFALADLSALKVGDYELSIRDQRDEQLTISFTITTGKYPILVGIDTIAGAFVKDTVDGWYNNEMIMLNVLRPYENGSMSFRTKEKYGAAVIGLHEVGEPKVEVFNHLDHAFYLNDTMVTIYERGDAKYLPFSIDKNDMLSISRIGNNVRFGLNGTTVHSSNVDPNKMYFVEMVIRDENDYIKDLQTTFKAFPPQSGVLLAKITGQHFTCDNVGQVSIPLLATYELPYSEEGDPPVFTDMLFTWDSPEGPGTPTTSPIFYASTPGIYNLRITGLVDGEAYIGKTQFLLGVEVDWAERTASVADTDFPNTLVNTSATMAPAIGSSSNTSPSGVAHSMDGQWVARTIGSEMDPCLLFAGVWPSYMDFFAFQDMTTGQTVLQLPVLTVGNVTLLCVALGNTVVPIMRTYPGHQIMAKVEGGSLLIDDLSDNLDGGPGAVSFPLFPNPAPHRIRALLPCNGSTMDKALASFGCAGTQRAVLQDDLTAGYHRTENDQLRFAYWEDYNSETLSYTIHSMDGQTILDDDEQPIAIQHGYNEVNIDLEIGGFELAEGFYWIEVTNAKGIKQYLRFRYDNSMD